MQWLFWVVYQNKKGVWEELLVHVFCMIFHENVPYLILYQWAKFQCHSIFPPQDIKPNVLLKVTSAI